MSQTHSNATRILLAVALFTAGMVGACHFHFSVVRNAGGDANRFAVNSCDCIGQGPFNQSSDHEPNGPSPAPAHHDCTLCKLLSQQLYEIVPQQFLLIEEIVEFRNDQPPFASWADVPTVYDGRAPPAFQLS